MPTKILLYSLFLLTVSCGSPMTTSDAERLITVTNGLEQDREDELLHLDAREVATAYGVENWDGVKVMAGEELIPFEMIDADGDGTAERLGLLLGLAAGESKSLTIVELAAGEKPPVFSKRTQAEISRKAGGSWEGREYKGGSFQNVDELHVPPEHTDHSWFIRYEGPGWESDLVGYRFYLDWRNATDIFGKKTTDMVLDRVGQDGFDSYHDPAPWGQDILKVGKSLGVGSIATWHDGRALRVEETDSLYCAIVQDGTLESIVRTKYHGWKVGDTKTDLTATLSIHAGSRLTKNELALSTPLDNICTGIGKLDNAELLTGEGESWGYLATWGQQSLAEDDLGMAVLYRIQDAAEVTEDALSHVVVLRPRDNQLTYYFLAAWEQEPGGIKTKQAFLDYLESVVQELDRPLTVQM